jgi:hypothetical protein
LNTVGRPFSARIRRANGLHKRLDDTTREGVDPETAFERHILATQRLNDGRSTPFDELDAPGHHVADHLVAALPEFEAFQVAGPEKHQRKRRDVDRADDGANIVSAALARHAGGIRQRARGRVHEQFL